jgi:putative membrane protein insertion efficiency factor
MGWGQKIVVFGLLFYKSQISPFLPSACKYQPTCSMYAKEAVERFGVVKGLRLTTLRLLRCHPFARGGHDPVPDA